MSQRCSSDHVPMTVVTFLGIYALTALIGMIFLIWHDAKEGLVALVSSTGSAAAGAIGGILSQTRNDRRMETQDVVVMNKTDEPIPVKEEKS